MQSLISKGSWWCKVPKQYASHKKLDTDILIIHNVKVKCVQSSLVCDGLTFQLESSTRRKQTTYSNYQIFSLETVFWEMSASWVVLLDLFFSDGEIRWKPMKANIIASGADLMQFEATHQIRKIIGINLKRMHSFIRDVKLYSRWSMSISQPFGGQTLCCTAAPAALGHAPK